MRERSYRNRREETHPRAAAVFSRKILLAVSAFLSLAPLGAEPIRITFLPPPMEGTLSLGIYDQAGKLVRTLHREAEEKAFTAGLNGFITQWDGRDDAGQSAAPGKYAARGYSVGELEVEGVAFHGNDWATGEAAPRFQAIAGPALAGEEIHFRARLASGQIAWVKSALDGSILSVTPAAATTVETPPALDEGRLTVDFQQRELVAEASALAGGEVKLQAWRGETALAFGAGKALLRRGGEWRLLAVEEASTAVTGCFGQDGTLWLIERRGEATFVAHRSEDGKALRDLPITAGEPVPTYVHAETAADAPERLALLEEAPGVQRLRVLQLQAAAAPAGEATPVSTWEVVLSRRIHASSTPAAAAALPSRTAPFGAEEKINVRLQPNELLKNVSRDLDLSIAHDAKGSFLRAADGLPLCTVTETPHLKWAVMGRDNGGKAVTIFQSDGAVVEEFRARKLANMMAFDAGEYEWTGK